MIDLYEQGLIDGLELALDICEVNKAPTQIKDTIEYFVKLLKERKYEKIKTDIGATMDLKRTVQLLP